VRLKEFAAVFAVAVVVAACTSGKDPTGPSGSHSSSGESGSAATIMVETKDLTDGAMADVVVSGVRPKRFYLISMCLSDVEIGAAALRYCDLRNSVQPKSDSSGQIAQSVQVHTFVASGKRLETSCLPDLCKLAAVDALTETVLATSDVSWSSTASLPDAPSMEIQGYNDASGPRPRRVAIVGQGFPADENVPLAQCPATSDLSGVDADDCLYTFGTVARSDAEGNIVAAMRLYPRFQRSSGEWVQCGVSQVTCVVAYVFPEHAGVRMSLVAFP
jgi:hypothetical protein